MRSPHSLPTLANPHTFLAMSILYKERVFVGNLHTSVREDDVLRFLFENNFHPGMLICPSSLLLSVIVCYYMLLSVILLLICPSSLLLPYVCYCLLFCCWFVPVVCYCLLLFIIVCYSLSVTQLFIRIICEPLLYSWRQDYPRQKRQIQGFRVCGSWEHQKRRGRGCCSHHTGS